MKNKIIGDFHLHTSFSGDSDSPMDSMIQSAIEKGLSIACITEHLDLDYPKETGLDFSLDTDSYYRKYLELKEAYASQIDLRFGVELGLQPQLTASHTAYVQQYPFDFVIGSSHVVHGFDPYYGNFYEGRTEHEAYLEYFTSILENLDTFTDIDVYGHIDYVVRYGPTKNQNYSYAKYQEILDEILRKVIGKGIGIECNTGGIKYGLGHPNPCEEVLARYHELGGEILTIGSDAHQPVHVGYAFEQMTDLLKGCGFTYYTIYKDRKPEFLPL